MMYNRLDRVHRAAAVVAGLLTLMGVAALLAWDFAPRLFPAKAHDVLGAFPLAMIAIAYLLYHCAHTAADRQPKIPLGFLQPLVSRSFCSVPAPASPCQA